MINKTKYQKILVLVNKISLKQLTVLVVLKASYEIFSRTLLFFIVLSCTKSDYTSLSIDITLLVFQFNQTRVFINNCLKK